MSDEEEAFGFFSYAEEIEEEEKCPKCSSDDVRVQKENGKKLVVCCNCNFGWKKR